VIYFSRITLPNGQNNDFYLIPSTTPESFQFFVSTNGLTRSEIISYIMDQKTFEIDPKIIKSLSILNEIRDVNFYFPNWKTSFNINGNFLPDGSFGKRFIFSEEKTFDAFYFKSQIIQETNEKGSELAGVILLLTRSMYGPIDITFDPENFLSGILLSNNIGKVQENAYLTMSLVFPQIHHLSPFIPPPTKKWFFNCEKDYCDKCFNKLNISDIEKKKFHCISEENVFNFKKNRGYYKYQTLCDGEKCGILASKFF
jgi:hypothetical protein